MTNSVNSQNSPISAGLAAILPHPQTPWLFSKRLFERIRKQESASSAQPKAFTTCEILSSDPEYDFMLKYFFHQKPPGYSIKRILIIHNIVQTRKFRRTLLEMDEEALKLQPSWDEEDLKSERSTTMKRWQVCVAQFSPVELATRNKTKVLERAKVLPLWHGTSNPETICSKGFSTFGKRILNDESSQPGAAPVTYTTDFGNGIYFSTSAKCASMCHSGTLLLSWVSMREPYPVVSDVPSPKVGKDMLKLQGKAAYKNYNAHYIPVTASNPEDPKCMTYHPCHSKELPAWDEYVVFQKKHALPRFLIELAVDMPRTLSTPIHSLQNRIAVGSVMPEKKQEYPEPDMKDFSRKPAERLFEIRSINPVREDFLGRNALHTAALSGDAQVLSRLAISHKHLLDSRDRDQATPLIMAANEGHVEVCKVLLKAGADPLAKDKDGRTPLHDAAGLGRLEVVQLLSTQKHLVDRRDNAGYTPFLMAAYHGFPNVCDTLLQAGADLNAKTAEHERNVMHVAACQGRINMIRFLAQHKHLINSKDKHDHTPLALAALFSTREVCKELLALGENPEIVNNHGRNVLLLAASKGNASVVQLFAPYKELLESRDKEGHTPLLLAAGMSGHRESCEILIDAKAEVNATNPDGSSALQTAAEKGYAEVVSLFIRYKHLIDAKDKRGFTPLMRGASFGNRKVCAILLGAGACADATEAQGMNAFHWAAFYGKTDSLELLLSQKELINVKTTVNECSSLQIAAAKGHREVCEMLLRARADVNATNRINGNVLHSAVACQATDIVKLFTSQTQLLDGYTKAGLTPLHVAAMIGSTAVCKILLEARANLHASTRWLFGSKPIDLAKKHGHHNVVKFLTQWDEDNNL